MTESFGARLRQQRERQQIALAAIADQTKISLSLLEGLERDDVSHWPAGIFRRSFVRAYAQLIHLEPDAVVREFLDLYPEPIDAGADVAPGIERESPGQRPPTRLECLVASTIRNLPRLRQVVQEQGVRMVQELVAEQQVVQEQVVQEQVVRPHAVQEQVDRVVEERVVHAVQESKTPAAPAAEACIVSPEPARAPTQPEIELSAIAHLCTELARVLEIREVAPLLERAGRILGAVGLVVWVWDPETTALKPALAYGYPDDVLARLPEVGRDTDNATAESFRSGETRIVNSSDLASGAVVVPLLTPAGCGGVLAVELRQGGEQRESVRALATIFAAQLATFVGSVPLAQAANA